MPQRPMRRPRLSSSSAAFDARDVRHGCLRRAARSEEELEETPHSCSSALAAFRRVLLHSSCRLIASITSGAPSWALPASAMDIAADSPPRSSVVSVRFISKADPRAASPCAAMAPSCR